MTAPAPHPTPPLCRRCGACHFEHDACRPLARPRRKRRAAYKAHLRPAAPPVSPPMPRGAL